MEPSTDRNAEEIWVAVLDDLETQLNRAERFVERLDAETIASWAAPQPGVPMPRYLVPRAQALLERQQAIIDAIPGVMASVQGRVKLSSRFSGSSAGTGTGTHREGAVYVDVTA